MKKTQWYSADRTKKFGSDDKSSPQYIHSTIGPGQYTPNHDDF